MFRKLGQFLLIPCLAGAVLAQDPIPTGNPAIPAAANPAALAALRTPTQDPQPYEKVITKDAKTTRGIFAVHQIKDKYYYEIPKTELGKEFL